MISVVQKLNLRREHLGISQSNLAEMTGVSLPTIQRFFSEDGGTVSFETACKIAEVLGCSLDANEVVNERSLLERQARIKARWLASIVQGTSSLEAQGLNKQSLTHVEEKFYHKLLGGSRRKLWSA